MTAPILPGAATTLGVLGGGQLGRMFAQAAQRMGFRVAVFSQEKEPPASQVVDRYFRARYDDLDRVAEFARTVDVVTFEFENVPAATAAAAAQHAPVRPAGTLLHTTQNRRREKTALRSLGLPVAEFAVIGSEDDLATARQTVPGAGIVKTTAWGYDGKGQRRVANASELADAWHALDRHPVVVEALVPFEREISVIGARGLDGDIAVYEPFDNTHVDQILDLTVWPAQLAARTRTDAHEIARTVLEGLDVVGVLCVEMFLLPDGTLLVNELAPRPHNSGHLTIDACVTSQFEQQARAVAGLPLGSVDPVVPAAAMTNLLGDAWQDGEPAWAHALRTPHLHLHLYGKHQPRPGRKMGHLTATGTDRDQAVERARTARAQLRG